MLLLQSDYEIARLLEIYKEKAPRNVVELGSLHGATLKLWIDNAPKHTLIISVDMLIPANDCRAQEQIDGHNGKWASWAREKEVEFIGISTPSTYDATIDLIDILMEDGIDFLFIDADHTYNQVKKDFEVYLTLMARNGVIAFHDIVKSKHPNCEVDRFWQELQQSGEYRLEEIIDSRNLQEYGIGVVYL